MFDPRDVCINQFDRTNSTFELLPLLCREILRVRPLIEELSAIICTRAV